MTFFRQKFLGYNLIFAFSFCVVNFLQAQDTINVQVKVFDLQLNPVSNLEIKVQDTESFKSNALGIAFIKTSEASLPPSDITILDQKLEVESWNYSKGILEIIVRKKKYSQIVIKIIDLKTNAGLSGIEVSTNFSNDKPLVSDTEGNIFLILPNSVQVSNPELFNIEGFRIVEQNIDTEGGTLILDKIILQDDLSSEIDEKPVAPVQELSKNPDTIEKDKADVLQDINIEDLDSITSLTVLYALMTKINYNNLDSDIKNKLNSKFNELVNLDINSSSSLNALEIISDSSAIDNDISQIIEKIQYEEKLLNDSKEEFEIATNQIKEKITDGGKNLGIEERKQLIQLVINLKEMLKNNEQLFYKNNIYQREQVETLLRQLANIHELEDLLSESEEMTSEFKKKLAYTFLAFVPILGIAVLLIYLVKILGSKKDKLAKANEEIKKINLNLESLITEKTVSLKLINKELDTFFYRSSHNLKRPITSIRGLANIAEITLNSESVNLFNKVVLTIEEMDSMLNKLTMMSHINQPVDFDDIDLKKIVDNIRSNFSNEMEHITFNVSALQNIQFKSYAQVVDIMLNNLLENAFFFSTINQNQSPKVDMSVKTDQNGSLQISIRDNGCGIHTDVQEKIWDMFFIGNESSKGNGLGLYITKKAVDSLNGTITLNTKYDEYCEFNIVLPSLPSSSINV